MIPLPSGADLRISRWRWELRRLWDRMDAPVLVAVALVAFWAGLQLTVVAPLDAAARRLSREVQVRELAAQAGRRAQRDQVNEEGSGDLAVNFPRLDEREAQLQGLHELVEKKGLQLSQAEYRSEEIAALGLKRHEVRLGVQGQYAQQRLFIHELLARYSNLAVERISLERAGETAGLVNGQVDIRFYYRVESGRRQ